MNLKWIILFALVCFVAAHSKKKYGHESEEHHDSESEEYKYKFKYDVSAEDSYENELKFGHKEEKKDDYVKGKYYAKLPENSYVEVKYKVSDEEHSEEYH